MTDGADLLASPSGDRLGRLTTQMAATRRFSLGVPRSLGFTPTGSLRFVRARGPRDPVNLLWETAPLRALEAPPPPDPDLIGFAAERLLIDPADLLADIAGNTMGDSVEEQARRQRARELSGGVTTWTQDQSGDLISLVVAGQLFSHRVSSETTTFHATPGPAFDPRPAPDSTAIAVVIDGQLRLLEMDSSPPSLRQICGDDGARWGVAEFIAAEEMGRHRGYWWSPNSQWLAVCRVDETPVASWHLHDPADPAQPPRTVRYPAAGTTNADVGLWLIARDGSQRTEVTWDRRAFPYLTRVEWDRTPMGSLRLTLTVQSRDQHRIAVLAADTDSGATRAVHTIEDGGALELAPGCPTWLGDRLVTVEDDLTAGAGGSRRLMIDGSAVTPAGLQVRAVAGCGDDDVVFTASTEPTLVDVWRWNALTGLGTLTPGDGVYSAVTGYGFCAITGANRDDLRPQVSIGLLAQPTAANDATPTDDGLKSVEPAPSKCWNAPMMARLTVASETPEIVPQPRMMTLGTRALRAALYLPSDGAVGAEVVRLPVVLDPYGGPHAQRVLRAGTVGVASQWLADHGFAVLVIDGRGTPGRGPVFERAVHGDLAGPVLDDQLEGLDDAARMEPRLDLDRVGIRGWSFGGYLAALAAIRAPERIRAAVAGAPVTDWRLYDTHYTERYLGHPDQAPEAYVRSSLIDAQGLLAAAIPDAELRGEIMLLHGMMDDNVVVAHSLRLAQALFAAAWPHRLVTLGSVTHFATDADVTRRMMEAEAAFLIDVLGAHEPR